MKKEELEVMLRNNSECNFIAYGNTVLHACGVDAVIKYLLDKEIEINGYILMAEHGVTGRVLSENNFITRNERIKYIDITASEYRDFTGIRERMQLLFKKQTKFSRRIYFVTPTFDTEWYSFIQSIYPDAKIIHVIIDDGGATYENPMLVEYQYMRQNEGDSTSQLLKYLCSKLKLLYRVGYVEIWKKHLIRQNQCIYGTIYKKKINRSGESVFEKNEPFSRLYKEVFAESAVEDSSSLMEAFESTILINTQCFEENDLTDGIVDYNTIERFLKCLEGIDIPVVLKPHPRELKPQKYETLGCRIIYEQVSQEKMIARAEKKPKCIVSFYSSMLFNAKGLFDVPAISLARILLKEDIPQALKIELEGFYKDYKSIIYFPEDYEELKKILKKILR